MKKLAILACAAILAGLSAREPSMKVTEKVIDRKGVKLTQKEWVAKFHHSEMNLKITLDADGKIVKKAWGDFFLGLRHGTIYNGSWDIWQFIAAKGMKSADLPSSAPVERVSFVRFPDSSSANMVWKNGEIRVLQTSGAANWVYVKVIIPEGVRNVSLVLRPGGAHTSVKGRERWIRYNGKDTPVNFFKVRTMEVAPKVDGMAIYSKNYNEKYGNFLVFESEKVAKITQHTENPVTIFFHAKPGVKELNFALGYFANQDPEEAMQRFLVEQAPTVRKSLDAIQWDKAPDFSEFTKNAAQVKSLIAGVQGDAKAKFEKEFAEIQKAYEDAKAKNDIPAYTQALERLRKLQKSIGAASLGDLM